MEQPQKFRSALNGFNREDVVHYLEYINNKHAAQVAQLNGDAEQLRRQLDDVDPEELDALKDRCEELEAALDAANAEKDALQQQVEALTRKVQELEQAAQEPKAAPAPVKEAAPVFSGSATQELEAYRRAERAERMAKERAQQICRQTNAILADATLKVDGAAAQIGAVTDQVMAQLNLLQSAVSSSRLALQEAAVTMSSLTAEEE